MADKPKVTFISEDQKYREFDNGDFRLDDVRMSYPHIFKPAEAKKRDDGTMADPRYECTFLIPVKTHEKAILAMRKRTLKLISESYPHIVQPDGKKLPVKIPPEKWCLRDARQSDKPEYQGCWTLKALSSRKPDTLDGKGSPCEAGDGILYAGCRVSVLFRMWAQGTPTQVKLQKFGKRVNGDLQSVRFMFNDTAFSKANERPDLSNAFGDLDKEGSLESADAGGLDDDFGGLDE